MTGRMEERKVWKRNYVVRWIVYGCGVLLPFGALFVLVRQIAGPICIPAWLENLVNQKAMAEIIGTIGATAIVIAWLVNVTGQTVCGERIGELAKWAYPHFFHFYFFEFLVNFFVGVYIANGSSHRFATALITLSLIIGMIFIGRVCYVFVIDQKSRERIAYTYYRKVLKYRQPVIARAKTKGKTRARFNVKSERALLRLTDYVSKAEAAGESLPYKTIFELWDTLIRSYKDVFPVTRGISHNCCSMAERFWDEIIKAQPYAPMRGGFLIYVVNAEKDGLCRNHLLVGLLLRMKRAHKNEDLEWNEACDLLFELIVRSREGKPEAEGAGLCALQKLILGLSWIMAIEFLLQSVTPDFTRLRELAYRTGLAPDVINSEENRHFLDALYGVYTREFGYEDGIYGAYGRKGLFEVLAILLNGPTGSPYSTVLNSKDMDEQEKNRCIICWALEWSVSENGDERGDD